MHRHYLPLLGPMFLVAIIPYKQWEAYWGAFPLWQAHRAAAVAALVVLALILFVRWLTGSWARSALVVAFPVIGLLARDIDRISIFILVGVTAIASLLDRSRRAENASLAVTIMGGVLFAGAFLQVSNQQGQESTVIAAGPDAISSITLSQTPSIIHVVLDGYGSSEVLSRVYGHDTKPFFSALERRGFSVVPDAVSPYSQTLPSIASVMSGAPVDLTSGSPDPRTLRQDLGYTIRNGPVPAALEQAGYTFAWSESGYHLLDFERASRISSAPLGLTAFETRIIQFAPQLFGRLHNRMLKSTLTPGSLDDLPTPFFYYQHLIAPHPPFSINADGTFRRSISAYLADGDHFTRSDEALRRIYIEGYREKIGFIEQALLRQIDAFPAEPLIVIIHGDHGPGAFLRHEDALNTCLAERITTFAAVYSNVPGLKLDMASFAPRPFSIVNIYRLVLSRLSNTVIPPLDPVSRHLRWSDPREMTDVAFGEFDTSCGNPH